MAGKIPGQKPQQVQGFWWECDWYDRQGSRGCSKLSQPHRLHDRRGGEGPGREGLTGYLGDMDATEEL